MVLFIKVNFSHSFTKTHPQVLLTDKSWYRCSFRQDVALLCFLVCDAMLAQYMLSSCVCLSVCRPFVCLYVTSLYCTKMAKRTITQTTPYDSTGTLIFCHQRSWWNFNRFTPKGLNRRLVGQKRLFSTIVNDLEGRFCCLKRL